MATALTSQYTRFTDKCNRVLAGGVVKTFEPNSLIPKITYQDPLATIPNLPEVVLDSTGRARIYLLGDYRVQIYSNDGTLIEDNLYVDQGVSQTEFLEVNKTLIANVDSLEDLEEISNVWDGRTVYVKDLGHYEYDSDTTSWVKVYQDADNVKDGAETQKQINSEQRLINDGLTYREIHLSHLGAKFDGSDEKDIFQAAIDLADNNTTIVFDKTGFTFSSVDYGDKSVSLRGVPSISAQTLAVTVYISGAGIICNTQKVKSAYIDFQSTGTKTDGNNICLLTNNKNNGVWLHVKSVRASGFSGHVLYAKDLIDSEISDFVPNSNNQVFRFYKDAWVASTTIKLNKVYAQQNTLLFDADDCDHCTMIDCIYEFNADLGHINNGDWVAINTYIENNSSPLIAQDTYWLVVKQYSYTANDQVINTQPNIAAIDKGYSRINNRSIQTSQLAKGFERMTAIAPSFSGQTWTKLGTAYLTQGGTVQIEILAPSSFSQPVTPAATTSLGKTVIIAQAKNASQSGQPNVHATMYNIGVTVGVSQCRLVQVGASNTTFDVYILQDSNAYIGFKVDLNKGDYFEQNVQRLQAKPTGGGSGDVNTSTMLIAFPYVRMGAGTGYIGSDGINPILGGAAATTVGATGAAAALPANPVGYLTVNINGTNYKMPYYNT